MGPRWLIIYVICQMVITESLGGVTLPNTDLIGKVTPIKPKPLPASAVSSSVTKSSLVCDSKDILSKLFSRGQGTCEFSSPLAFTSSSRALPVPKIDASSIADVKLPERLREKVLSSKLFNTPIRNAKPDVLLPYKYPFLSSLTKSSNALPTYSSCDMYSSSLNKISSLTNIKSLPIVPIKPLKSSDIDALCSASISNNIFAQPNIIPLPRSRSLDSPITLETRQPSFSEQFNSNTFSSLSSYSSPYPLYYTSMSLPGVKTPEMLPLNFRPISYKAAGNIDFPSQSCNRNFLNLKTLSSDNSLNSLPDKNGPYLSKYLSPINAAEIQKLINTIQLPKTPTNVPVSINPVFSAQTAATKNVLPPFEANSGSASVPFESTIKQPEFLSSPVLKDCTDPRMLPSCKPNLLADKIPDFRLKPCAPIKIKPSEFEPPTNFLNSPTISLAPISPSSTTTDMVSNRPSSVSSSKNINTPHMFPIIGACVETIEKVNTYGPGSICQTCVHPKDVPSLERISLYSPFAPKLASYQHPLFTGELVTSQYMYSPPIIPREPIPTISFRSSEFSPITYIPSEISQSPSSITYVNQSPSSSIAQCTAKMVSSINELVSNIAQNILSSYKSYIDAAPQNIPQKPTIPLNPCSNPDFKIKQSLPVISLPQGNPVNKPSILPTITSSTNCINLPAVDTSTTVCSEAPCKSSAFEVSCCQPLLVPPAQLTATLLPSTPQITFSSPQPCPSCLPSSSLPSYPTVPSPCYIEAPVFKVSSTKKDSDIEKLIELMLLAEILNNDDSFDWDDLDTLLAFLSVS